MEESCFGFGKSKANSTFCKVVKQKGEGKPTFSTRSFPLSLRPSPLPCGDRGYPPDPYVITRKLRSFAFSPDNAVNFFLRSSLTPTNVLAAFAISFCQRNCVFLCKGTKLQKAVLFAIVRRSFMEEYCFCFWKAKETALLKKQAKICFLKVDKL